MRLLTFFQYSLDELEIVKTAGSVSDQKVIVNSVDSTHESVSGFSLSFSLGSSSIESALLNNDGEKAFGIILSSASPPQLYEQRKFLNMLISV